MLPKSISSRQSVVPPHNMDVARVEVATVVAQSTKAREKVDGLVMNREQSSLRHVQRYGT